MTEEEFLKRFDEHLAFCKASLARNDVLIDEQRRLHEEYRAERREAQAERRLRQEEHRQSQEAHRQSQEAHRQAQEEHRQSHAEHEQAVQDVRYELKQMSMRGERVAQGFITVLQDLVAESRARREALFAMIDQLRGDGPSAASA